jgi:hypothetical protein
VPPPGDEGCDDRFWKNDKNFPLWTRYSPNTSFDGTFGVASTFGGTLLDVLEQGGGGEKALGKHAVAALLNAASPAVRYAYTEGQIIQMVNDAYGSENFDPVRKELEQANKQGCPLR